MLMKLAYYQATIGDFLAADTDTILGELTKAHGFALELSQKRAWLSQITLLKSILTRLDNGMVLFEFTIPRMGKRADVVLVLHNKIIILEFKVGAILFDRGGIEQVHDYALDLKNFHSGSHDALIVPVLVATLAPEIPPQRLVWERDNVSEPLLANERNLGDLLLTIDADSPGPSIVPYKWLGAGYRPTPTIIEAAQALYQKHGVEEITRSDAGAKNLSSTTDLVQTIIEYTKASNRKAICFVTGVPGAGKTLAGLNIATKRAETHEDEHAVFLSGNGPLVEVLREALARDKANREGVSRKDALREVSSFVQNIHHFRDASLRDLSAPIERVVVFDEAQRAWTKDKAAKFMRDRGEGDFDVSEPEFLISVMDRHTDWCVIVCLVGGGQEINTGEAGLSEWLAALHARFQHWDVHISDRLADPDYVSPQTAELLRDH